MIQPTDVTSAGFGIASALSWGAGDFCGGLAAKRTDVYRVVIGSEFAGAAALIVLALLTGETLPPASSLLLCGAAGLASTVGLLALYTALAIGRMGVAAPVSGVLCASLPVLAGTLYQGPPRLLTLGGFALALVAVWLVARTGDAAIHVRELGLPVLAGMGFGCFIVLIGRANAGAVFWPLVAARVASLLVLTVIVPSSGRHIWPSGGHRTVIALTGLFDAGGNALLVAAAQAGRLDVAGVLASLYPAGTVLLAWRVTDEHITGWQFLGLMASLAAIAAIASP